MKGLVGRRVVLSALAAVLFVSGIYFGIRVGKPPPRPDLGSLTKAPEPAREPTIGRSRPKELETDSEPPTSEPQPSSEVASVPVDTPPLNFAEPSDPPLNRTSKQTPKVAIVVDDLGRSLEDLERFGALDVPLTYSVLPFEVRTAAVVAELSRRQLEFLCHLPMEPRSGANPGLGALLKGMSPSELRAATRSALAATPGAVGVNNHMGSAIVADRTAMRAILEVVAEHQLFFLDSRTSVDTLGFTIARELEIPATERQVFLDSDRDPAAIEHQFQRLLDVASSRGSALAIAHPHLETLQVLARGIPAAKAQGVEFVVASRLLQLR